MKEKEKEKTKKTSFDYRDVKPGMYKPAKKVPVDRSKPSTSSSTTGPTKTKAKDKPSGGKSLIEQLRSNAGQGFTGTAARAKTVDT